MLTNLLATVTVLLTTNTETQFSTHEQWNSDRALRWDVAHLGEDFSKRDNRQFIDNVPDEHPTWKDEVTIVRQATIYHIDGAPDVTTWTNLSSETNHFVLKESWELQNPILMLHTNSLFPVKLTIYGIQN